MGFALLISTECLAQNEKLAGQPLGCIEEELRTIFERLPEKHVKALQKVQIWVEWDHTIAGDRDSQPLAVYYGGVGESLLLKGIDPRKSRNITILTLKDIYKLKSTGKFPTTVLIHELAHAVHDFNIGFDNVFVDNAYRQARSRRLYEKVENRDGKKVVGYASSNSHEYFAELSTCYLDQIPYAPFDANGLREYDSIGYELMTKVWGTIEQIDKAKKDDVERKLKRKVKK